MTRRDPRAFAPVLDEGQHRVALATFRRMGLDLHDAEDCAQTTMLRVHRALHGVGYEPRAPFGAFVRRVASCVFADWCRWRRVRRTHQARATLVEAEQLAAPVRLEPHQVLDLREAVGRLPERLRSVLELAVDQGLPYRVVAERLGIPQGTVKSRMHLAVQRLREELDHGA